MDTEQPTNAGREQGAEEADSGGYFPDKPIGPGNPPRASMWRAGHSGNPGGMEPGTQQTQTIMREVLSAERELTDSQKAAAATLLGKPVERLTNRELICFSLVTKAIARGSVEAAMAAFKLAGEVIEKGDGLPMQGAVIFQIPAVPMGPDGKPLQPPVY